MVDKRIEIIGEKEREVRERYEKGREREGEKGGVGRSGAKDIAIERERGERDYFKTFSLLIKFHFIKFNTSLRTTIMSFAFL